MKRAIAWIREHGKEYGGDPDYIAITGGSAGGHLTALAALTANDPDYQPGFEDADTTVQAAVPLYGVYDFAGVDRAAQRRADARLLPRPAGPSDSRAPTTPSLRGGLPDPAGHRRRARFFVIHGVNDTLVPVGQARHFVERLRARPTRAVAYSELPGTQHAFDVFPSIRTAHVVRGVDRFLRWHWNTWRATEPGQQPVARGGLIRMRGLLGTLALVVGVARHRLRRQRVGPRQRDLRRTRIVVPVGQRVHLAGADRHRRRSAGRPRRRDPGQPPLHEGRRSRRWTRRSPPAGCGCPARSRR